MLPNAVSPCEGVDTFFFFALSVGTQIEKEKDTKQVDVFEEGDECVKSEEKKSALPCW